MFTPNADTKYAMIVQRSEYDDMYNVVIYNTTTQICEHSDHYNILWTTRAFRPANIVRVVNRITGNPDALISKTLIGFAKDKGAEYDNMCG